MIQGEIMKTRNLAVIIYKEDDLYIAECPEVGTVDQGETIEAAIEGLKIATQLYLESFPMPEISPRFIMNIETSTITDREYQVSSLYDSYEAADILMQMVKDDEQGHNHSGTKETDYLLSISGMGESILEGMATHVEDCDRALTW